MKGKVILLFLRCQQGYGAPNRTHSMQQIHLKMHFKWDNSCTSVNNLPAAAHLFNSLLQGDYRDYKGCLQKCEGQGGMLSKSGVLQSKWSKMAYKKIYEEEKNLISTGSLKWKGLNIKKEKRCKQEPNWKLPNITSSVFLERPLSCFTEEEAGGES